MSKILLFPGQPNDINSNDLHKSFRQRVLSGENPSEEAAAKAREALSEVVGISVESMDFARDIFLTMKNLGATEDYEHSSSLYCVTHGEETRLRIKEVVDIINTGHLIQLGKSSAFGLSTQHENWLGSSEIGSRSFNPNLSSPFFAQMQDGSQISLTEGQMNFLMIVCSAWTMATRIRESS